MLSDILGVSIAFVSIILLLSILVTALVQFVQAALQLRARNLRKGLADLFREFDAARREEGARTDAAVPAPKQYTDLAGQVLNSPRIALMDRANEPSNSFQRLFRNLTGPNISWIDAKKLPEVLEVVMTKQDEEELPAPLQVEEGKRREQAEVLAGAFKESYPLLQRRFQLRIRWLTFGIALAVAVAFQVSTPRLLGELREDAERRNAIVAGAERLLETAAADLRRLDYEDAAIEALQVLQVEYPKQSALIGQASGTGTTRRAVVEELALVLEDLPEGRQIVRRYERLLDTLSQEQLDTAREVALGAQGQLAEYEVFFWPEGLSFYFVAGQIGLSTLRGNVLLGVLVTAILLSFGAPFWYEMLRNLVNLRDTLSGKSGTSSKPRDDEDDDKDGTATSTKSLPATG